MAKSVVARWASGLVFDAISESGGEVRAVGDSGAAGNRPTELLLAALATCTAMDVIDICRKKRQIIDGYEVHVTGEQWASIPASFRAITVEHRFRGRDIDPKAVARAIELSATRYCMIIEQFARGDATVRSSYVIEGEDGTGEDSGGPVEVVTVGPGGAGLQAGSARSAGPT